MEEALEEAWLIKTLIVPKLSVQKKIALSLANPLLSYTLPVMPEYIEECLNQIMFPGKKIQLSKKNIMLCNGMARCLEGDNLVLVHIKESYTSFHFDVNQHKIRALWAYIYWNKPLSGKTN